MVSLLIKQKVFSWFDSYRVLYEDDTLAFTVQGQLAWGHLLKIYDEAGREVGTIKERVLAFLPKFELWMGQTCAGTISREFTFFKPKYHIDFNGWRIEGDIMEWNYAVFCAQRTVMTIQKKIWNWSDTYQIDIADQQDVLCALMVVLAIDAANCSGRD